MKRSDAKSIAEIIGDFMQQEDIEATMLEHKALSMWAQVVGPGVNRLTTERYVDEGVITVKISSAALRNDLMLSRTAIINQLNQLSQLNPAQSNSTITHKTEESFTPPTAEHTVTTAEGRCLHCIAWIFYLLPRPLFNPSPTLSTVTRSPFHSVRVEL